MAEAFAGTEPLRGTVESSTAGEVEAVAATVERMLAERRVEPVTEDDALTDDDTGTVASRGALVTEDAAVIEPEIGTVDSRAALAAVVAVTVEAIGTDDSMLPLTLVEAVTED